MKKLLFVTFLFVSYASNLVAQPGELRCDIVRMGKGNFHVWYDIIQYIGAGNSENLDGLEIGGNSCMIVCTNPGSQRCRAENVPNPPSNGYHVSNDVFTDGTQTRMVDLLLDYADELISRGTMVGSHEMRVQVLSESFERVYSITWNLNEFGDGKMQINRKNVQI